MAGRTTGRYAKFFASISGGVPYTNVTLTLSATKTIAGTVYTDQFYGYSNAFFNRKKAFDARPQGLVGAIDIITPASGNNSVQTAAFNYYPDITIQAVAADTAIAIVRPAATKYNWNLVVVDTVTDAVSAVTGTDGGAYSDTWGAAGGPPLVAVTQLILGAVKLSSDAAAPIVQGDIFYTLSDGTLIQERADIPSYEIHPVEGGILFTEAFQKSHTASVGRKVYSSFYDFSQGIVEIAHCNNLSLNTTAATVTAEAYRDIAGQTDSSGVPQWSGSVDRYYVGDDTLFLIALDLGYCLMKTYPNFTSDSGKYLMGTAFISGLAHAQPMAWVTNTLSFQGDGILKRVGF